MKKIFYALLALMLLGVSGVAMYVKGDTLERKRDNNQPAQVKKPALYVSLGDSVASGLGAGKPTDSSGCGRTDAAYPYVVAKQQGYQLIHLACSGATIDQGISGIQTAAGEQLSQFEQLANRKPEVITIGIGANDVAWVSLLAKCLETACGSEADRRTYEAFLNETFQPNLTSTLRRLDGRYGENAKIIILGYYQVFPSNPGVCSDTGNLTASQLEWARFLRSRLNDTIETIVRETSVGEYFEPDFNGHELCAAEPYVQGLGDPAPYHANAAGHAAIARQLSKVIE